TSQRAGRVRRGYVMGAPQEHLAYLSRTGYTPRSPVALSEEEAAVLRRYGYWLEALASGAIAPTTPEQRHFVQAARGEAAPAPPLERVGANLRAHLGAPAPGPAAHPEPASKFEELAEARKYLDGLRKHVEAEREAILDAVRSKLEALDAQSERRL